MRHRALTAADILTPSRRDRGALRFASMLCLGLVLAMALAAAGAAAPTPVCASTSGPLMAGTGSDVDGPGARVWSYPENITADDTNYATVDVPKGGILGYYHTHYLCGTDFGFSIPSGSTIDGIQVTIARMMSGPPNGIHDDELYLIKGGSIAGQDKSTEDEWPNMVIGEATYGATDNCWGLSWTADDINASSFGVALCVYNASWVAEYTAYVDYMQVTVTYTLPGTTTAVATSGTPSTYGDSVTFTATVTALAGTNTPSGTVTFKEGVTTLGTGTLSGGAGVATATYSTTALSTGTHGDITAVYGGDSNFTGSASPSISQTVNARLLTITASDRSKTYGDTLSFTGTEFTAAGLVNSDAVTSVTLSSTGTGASATAGTHSIVPGAAVGTGLGNYSISYVNGTLTVNQKALTITASNRSKTYGDAVTFAGTEFTTSGLVNSDTVSSVTLGSTGAGSAATVAGGPYSITPSGAVGTGLGNYSISYVNGTLTVNQKALTITASNRSKTYGDSVAFAGTEFTPEGLVNTDSVTSVTLSSSGASAAATVAGSPYSIVPSAAVGTGLANYSISYVNGSLTVGLKALAITASNRSKTYGDAVTFAGTEFTASGLVNSDAVTSVTLSSSGASAAATVAGSPYSITPSGAVGTGLGNYSISYVNGSLAVSAKALTITASNRSKTYGDSVTFAGTEFTASGLVNSDSVSSVTLTSAGAGASASVAGSPYSITPSGAAGTGLANYGISYADGTLTVNQRPLTITASNRSKTYGDTVTFAGTEFATSGLVNSDTVTSVALSSAGASAAATVAGSPYSITPSGAAGTGLANYSISYADGALTVGPRALTISADDRGKTYGTTATFAGTEFSPAGLVTGDSVDSVTLTSAGAGPSAPIGAYPIVPSNALGTGLANYSITYVNGALTVSAKALTITASDSSKTYGDTVTFAGNEFTVIGLEAGDSVDSVTLTSSAAPSGAVVGAYPIIPSAATGTGLGDYTIVYVNGTLTVGQRDLTVTATGVSRVYDGTTAASVTLSTDAISGDNVTAGYTGASFADRNAGSGKTISVTGISISGDAAANYNLLNTTASTTASIAQRPLTITAQTDTKTYDGDTSAAAVPVVSGLAGSDTVTGLGETYDNRNAGTGKTLSVISYVVNDGHSGQNYSVILVEDTTGVIIQRDLTVTATGVNRVYDGTTTASVTLSTDAISDDNVTASCTGAEFPDRDAGPGKAVSVTGISISGADAANYNLLNTTGSTAADVNRKALTITANDCSKDYGESLTLAGTEFAVVGLEAGDSVGSVTLTSTGADASAASGIYDIVCGGAAGSGLDNYTITYINGALTVNKVSLIWTLAVSPESPAPGDPVTFTATVDDPEATGTVTFMDGDTVLGTCAIDHGVATLTVPELPAGSHSVTISYNGDPNFAGGTSSAYVCDVNLPAKSSWWLIVCIAAGVMAGFLCLLLFLWRRRQRRQPLAANATSSRAAAADAAAGHAAPAKAAGAVTSAVLPAPEIDGDQEKAGYSTEATLQSIWSMVETENPDVAAHQKRASHLAGAIAAEMGLPQRQIAGIRSAAELHDIGQVIEPADAGNEPGKPSEGDSSAGHDHPRVAFDILKNLEFDGPVAQAVAQHHERLDGSGYPYGLSGEDVLLEARVLAVADVVDEMLTNRPDRPAPGLDAALAELANGAGSLYDPEVVAAFQRVFGKTSSETEPVSTHP